MPPEYCEYGPDYESHCLPWLQQNHPELYKGKQLDSSAAVTPTEPWTLEKRLTEFYTKYVPEKIESIPGLLEKYAGKEDKLFEALVKKYGPEPEDPFYAADDAPAPSGGNRKRRGASAKKGSEDDAALHIVIQKVAQKKRRNITIVSGMEGMQGIKLKDVSKTFSKKFAGSSSVKDNSIIVQGDHVYEAAELLVDQFQVPEESIFLDLDGEIVPLK